MNSEWIWRLYTRLGYGVARQLLGRSWLVKQPRVWQWMQGQLSCMASLGHRGTQAFYGYLLLLRGQDFGAREEGLRLLCLAASTGDRKTAYQLGVQAFRGDSRRAPDTLAASRHRTLAAEADHPLAARKLAELYRDGGSGLAPGSEHIRCYVQRASALGLQPNERSRRPRSGTGCSLTPF